MGDPFALYGASMHALQAAGAAGDIGGVDRCLAIMQSVAGQLDQPSVHWMVTSVRAGRALIAGDTDVAEQLATEALQIGTDAGQPDATQHFEGLFMIVSWQRGTLGDLVPLVRQAVADNPGIPAYTAALAGAYAEAGSIDDLHVLLDELAAADFDLPLDPLWLSGMCQYAEAAVECQDRQHARSLFDRIAAFADQWCCLALTTHGPVSHYLGGLATVLSHYDEADSYFTRAAAISARMGAKFDRARANLSWGKMLAIRDAPGDGERALDRLTNAHEAAVAHGYGNVERRAAAALQRLS
jgi:tetratricopeptide (TPR) repeat protein